MKDKEKYTKETDFASVIYNLRMKHHLTQKQLADLINVSDRTVSKWENGQTVPDIINIQNICDSLGVSPSYIVHAKKNLKDKTKKVIKKVTSFLNYLIHNVFILGFIIMFIILLLYFLNNYNALKFYKLKYTSDEISFGSGYFIQTKEINVLAINDIKISKIDYNSNSINLILYTHFNGDKVILYESNKLESIFIEELRSYPDVLTDYNIKNLKNSLYLDITLKDKDGKDYLFTSIITLNSESSNDGIIYDKINQDRKLDFKYTEYLSNDLPIYKSPSNIIMNKFEDKFTRNVSKEKSLESLGYTYNSNLDTYNKENENETIEYSISLAYLKYTITADNVTYKYYFNGKTILKTTYNKKYDNKKKTKILLEDNNSNYYYKKDSNISKIISIYQELQAFSK